MAQPIRIIGHNKDSVLNEQLQAQVFNNGSLSVDQNGFVLVDSSVGEMTYYGFYDGVGNYVIARIDTSTNQTRFYYGTSGYLLAWANRESLSYSLPSGRTPQINSPSSYGNPVVEGKPRVSCTPYLYDISEGEIPYHTPWSKIGFNPAVTTTMEEIWSYGGTYTFLNQEVRTEVASDSAAADGDVGAIAISGTCDSGTTTTLVKNNVDFGDTCVVGDILLIDKSGIVPEWAVITDVLRDTITFAGGLSSGGTCSIGRTFHVLTSSAARGAMAVKVDYLDSSFEQHTEIFPLNATTQVSSADTDYYRINSFRVIAVGTKSGATNAAIGNITIREADVASPFYSYISAGYTRARNIIYTVPANKTLYIVHWNAGSSTNNDTKVQTCRMMIRANAEPATGFFGHRSIFYGYTEFLVSNAQDGIEFSLPLKFIAGTDIKVSAIGLTGFSGPVTSVLRGWLE